MPSDKRLAPFRDLNGIMHKPLDVPKSADGMHVVAVTDPEGPMIEFYTGRWNIRYSREEVKELIARLQEWVDEIAPNTGKPRWRCPGCGMEVTLEATNAGVPGIIRCPRPTSLSAICGISMVRIEDQR